MKKTILFLSMLLCSTAVYAEAGKGIHFSFGEVLLIFLVIFLIAAIFQFAISISIYAILNATTSNRRKNIWGTFWCGFLGGLLTFFGAKYWNGSTFIISLIFSSAGGSAFGFLISPRKVKKTPDTTED